MADAGLGVQVPSTPGYGGPYGPQTGPHPRMGTAPHLGNWVMREAYSHEVSSCGFWPGGGSFAEPAFYSYSYPQPAGFATAKCFAAAD